MAKTYNDMIHVSNDKCILLIQYEMFRGAVLQYTWSSLLNVEKDLYVCKQLVVFTSYIWLTKTDKFINNVC